MQGGENGLGDLLAVAETSETVNLTDREVMLLVLREVREAKTAAQTVADSAGAAVQQLMGGGLFGLLKGK